MEARGGRPSGPHDGSARETRAARLDRDADLAVDVRRDGRREPRLPDLDEVQGAARQELRAEPHRLDQEDAGDDGRAREMALEDREPPVEPEARRGAVG